MKSLGIGLLISVAAYYAVTKVVDYLSVDFDEDDIDNDLKNTLGI